MSNEKSVVFRPVEFAQILKKVRKLQSNRQYRDIEKLFFAEGVRNFVSAVDNNFSIETIIYSEKLLTAPIARKLVRKLKRGGTAFARISPEQFRQVSQTERASGVAAIIRQKVQTLEQIKPDKHICWTVVSHIRSAGNFGTLIRTSSAIGAGGFILIGNQIDPFDPNVVRATMGSVFNQTIIRTDYKEFRRWIIKNKLHVVGATPCGLNDYHKIRYPSPTILMLGNERSGLTEAEESLCKQLVKIPMTEGIDSLNVAVAGSLLLYEIFRSAAGR